MKPLNMLQISRDFLLLYGMYRNPRCCPGCSCRQYNFRFMIFNTNFEYVDSHINEQMKECITENDTDAFYLATNKQDRIYSASERQHKVIMFDFKFNIIKTVGSRGYGRNQFECPLGISFHKGYLYVCDKDNRRIQKLNEQLEFLQTYLLDYKPRQIIVTSRLACIRPFESNKNSIYFYDTHNFTLKKKYDGHNGYLSEINSCFYEYNSANKTFYCYDENGDLQREMKLKIFEQFYVHERDGCLLKFNNKIISSCFTNCSIWIS